MLTLGSAAAVWATTGARSAWLRRRLRTVRGPRFNSVRFHNLRAILSGSMPAVSHQRSSLPERWSAVVAAAERHCVLVAHLAADGRVRPRCQNE
jgi:hypothetical protein